MDQGRLQVIQFWSVVPALAEIGILVNRTWNEARYFGNFLLVITKDEGK